MKEKRPEFSNIPERLAGLEEFAGNLWWSWHPAVRMLYKTIDRQVWKDSIHNPFKVLKEVPGDFFKRVLSDPEYLKAYDSLLDQFRKELAEEDCWYAQKIPVPDNYTVAYFSAEYGLHHSLPFYAGGLGFLAGDHLKECSDLRVPLVAVGFMYPEGYVHQEIRDDGWQDSEDEFLDREEASITRVLDDGGKPVVVRVPMIDPPIHVAVWKVSVGRIPLYLLDTDIEINDSRNRKVLAHLYIGDVEQRLRQEIVLGIGGSEVLNTLGIRHSILHLNEGHPAFALLKRIRDRISPDVTFREAAAWVKNTSIITTHTPVPAGHDVFSFQLMEKYFKTYWSSLGLSRDEFLQLGVHPQDPRAGFNMTAFALRMCRYRNAVSRRHGEVARKMWQDLWPEIPEEKVPIGHVTNGVHVPTWIEPKMELLFNRYLGSEWISRHDEPSIWNRIDDIPDEELWKTHYWLKIKLIDAVRDLGRKKWTTRHGNPTTILAGGALLDPSVLTIGFARRFVTYKRADLIFHDVERLKKMLNSRWRPIQIIFAGKAHPADDAGKLIIQKIFRAACDPEMGGRIAFIEDYGEQFAQYIVHGVDLWLNNPLPPMEACGTSGMKAALNGVPSLSILDGWWVEGYNRKNGWAFGDVTPAGERNRADAEAIYRFLEDEIIPLYYRVSEDGVPHGWVGIMKETIKSNAPRFSARRMVREYLDRYYAAALKNI
jgi:starch phosphorylase